MKLESDRLATSLVKLSVSCIGSNGLKRVGGVDGGDAPTLSVSCIGSNGLKRDECGIVAAGIATFSILYRIEWVETRFLIY